MVDSQSEVAPRGGRDIGRFLYRMSLCDPQISPRGKLLTFLRKTQDATRSELVGCDLTGASEVVLVDGDIAMGGPFSCGSYSWSGDEKSIVALTQAGTVVRYDLETGGSWEIGCTSNTAEIVTSHHGDIVVSAQPQEGFVIYNLALGSCGLGRSGLDFGRVESYSVDRWVDASEKEHVYDFMTAPRLTPMGDALFGLGWSLDTQGVYEVELFAISLQRSSTLRGVSWHRSRGSLLSQPILIADGTVALLSEHEGRWAPYRIASAGAPLQALRSSSSEGDFGDVTTMEVQRTWALDARSVVGAVNLDGFGALVELSPGEKQLRRGVFGAVTLGENFVAGVRLGARAGSSIFCLDRSDGTLRTLRSMHLGGYPARDEVEPEVIRLRGWLDYRDHEAALGGDQTLVARVFQSDSVHRGTVVLCSEAPEGQERVVPFPLRSALLDRGINVIHLDARGTQGHGWAHREALLGSFGVSDVADYRALVEWVSRPGNPGSGLPIVLVGRSFGAWTALMVARRVGELLDAVMLVDPVCDLNRAVRSGLRVRERPLSLWFAAEVFDELDIVDEVLRSSSELLGSPEVRLGSVGRGRSPQRLSKGGATPVFVFPSRGVEESAEELGSRERPQWHATWPGSGAQEESSLLTLDGIERIVSLVERVVTEAQS